MLAVWMQRPHLGVLAIQPQRVLHCVELPQVRRDIC
jgi:hypothetical protein